MASSSQSSFVRQALSSHSALGLSFAALVYLLCLTGTLSVFADEFERWEESAVPESQTISAEAIGVAARTALTATDGIDLQDLTLTLPTGGLPRITVQVTGAGLSKKWHVAPDGSLHAPYRTVFAPFLVALHMRLHAPGTLGYFLVGLGGVGLLALTVSGVLAHPRLFRDAFQLRWGGAQRLKLADLHNRLSVWGLPFTVAVSLTGAYFGLVSLMLFAIKLADKDNEAARALALLGPPAIAANAAPAPLPDLAALVTRLRQDKTFGEPFLIFISNPQTAGQMVMIYTAVPRRLLYGDIHYFSVEAEGRIRQAGGAFGQQLYSAAYPLHFGSFGGMPVKILYGLLGLALTVTCASGVRIYLVRRRETGHPLPFAERLWEAAVWGMPLALAASGLAAILWHSHAGVSFSVMLVACAGLAFLRTDPEKLGRRLRGACAVMLCAAAAAQSLSHTASVNPAGLAVSVALLLTAGAFAGADMRYFRERPA